MVLTLLAAIFVFGLLVLVHELGHFVTAKLTGMRVREFAIGFGPQIGSVQKGETIYSLRVVPLGGYNDIAGMDPEDTEAGDHGFSTKSVPARMLVILAGSFMNVILPLVLFFGIFFFSGVHTPNPEPVLGKVLPGKPAAVAGLQQGDRVISIDGKPVATWKDFVSTVAAADGQTELSVTVERDGQTLTTGITPSYDPTTKRSLVGVMNDSLVTHPGLVESWNLALDSTWHVIRMMVDGLYRIVLELSGENLAGPVGIAQMAGEAAEMGLVPLLNFAALLSLNLAVINMFPLPGLDGGHFLGLCFEAVRGRALSPKSLQIAQGVGVALILLLMIYVTRNDVIRALHL